MIKSSARIAEEIEIRNRLEDLLKPTALNLEQRYNVICLKLFKLWQLTDRYETKTIFLEPQYQLLSIFHRILQDYKSYGLSYENLNKDIELQVLRCLWYLSRAVENRASIAAKENGLLPELLELIIIPRYSTIILNIILNCCLEACSHPYLSSHELGYLKYLSGRLQHANPLQDIDAFRAITYFSLSIDNSGAMMLQYHHIPHRIYQTLLPYGPNPMRWPNRYEGTEYWCLNTLMQLSTVSYGAWILVDLQAESFLHNFFSFRFRLLAEELKAFITLLNIWYNCDYSDSEYHWNNTSTIPFEPFPSTSLTGRRIITTTIRLFEYQLQSEQNYCDDISLFRFLLQVFRATMDYPEATDADEYHYLAHRGWAFGIIMIRSLITAIHHFLCLEAAICTIPSQRYLPFQHQYVQTLLLDPCFIPHVIHLLEIYSTGREPIRIFVEVGYISAGGGKDDHDVAIMTMRTLLRLIYAEDHQSSNETKSNRVIQRLVEEEAINIEILIQLKTSLEPLLTERKETNDHTNTGEIVFSDRKIPREVIYLARAVTLEVESLLRLFSSIPSPL